MRSLILAAPLIAGGCFSAAAQTAVPTVSTRNATRGTATTQPFQLPTERGGSPAAGAWPTTAWGTVGKTIGDPMPQTPVGRIEASGYSTAAVPPPTYRLDKKGNAVYYDPVTGLAQVYGTTTDTFKGR